MGQRGIEGEREREWGIYFWELSISLSGLYQADSGTSHEEIKTILSPQNIIEHWEQIPPNRWDPNLSLLHINVGYT